MRSKCEQCGCPLTADHGDHVGYEDRSNSYGDACITYLQAQLSASQRTAATARGRAISDAIGVLLTEWRKHPGTEYGDDLWAIMGMVRALSSAPATIGLHDWVQVSADTGLYRGRLGQVVSLRSGCLSELDKVTPLVTVKFSAFDTQEFPMTAVKPATME